MANIPNAFIPPLRQARPSGDEDAAVRNLNDVVQNTVSAMQAYPLMGAKKLLPVTLTSGSVTYVPHHVGHDPIWHIVDKNGPADIWKVAGNPNAKSTLALLSTQTVTITLLVK